MLQHLLAALPGRSQRLQAALARQIAELSIDEVCRLVSDKIRHMGLCEARGYIRARAAREVRLQSRLALARRHDVPADWEPLIRIQAAEHVAPLALRRITADATRRDVASTAAKAA